MNLQVNVFVVDDAPQVRKRLVALVGTVVGVHVVGESDSVQGAIDGGLNPDVDALLLDLQLTDGNGLQVLTVVKRWRPTVRTIVISNFTTQQHREASLAAGADIFLDKSQEFHRIPEVLRDWESSSYRNVM
jgi:DNA-binding NarL/FixJ family response regulator